MGVERMPQPSEVFGDEAEPAGLDVKPPSVRLSRHQGGKGRKCNALMDCRVVLLYWVILSVFGRDVSQSCQRFRPNLHDILAAKLEIIDAWAKSAIAFSLMLPLLR